MATQQYTGLEIAIIGMAGRFPGAEDIDAFWSNLKNGVESIRQYTDEELLEGGENPARLKDPLYVKAYSPITGKGYFDSAFFNYTPDEAMLMDPQVRLFYECVWAALEDAGCNIQDPKNKIGLFAGAGSHINWEVYAQILNREGLLNSLSAFQLSNARFMASQIAYTLNLRGPALFLDTACSTSLVAIHQACRSLLLSDCHIAVAGGARINSRPVKGYVYAEGMVHSRDGHCRTFDAEASGSVEGEGVAAVVLKQLKHAMKEGDKIWAIIKGTGINNDGNNKVGYTAPSVDGQSEAILMAQRWGKTEPESISLIEAHGTATRLGDPVEVEALKRVFGKSKEAYCALGSVKSNIGHTDTTAGVAGLIKAVLALKNRMIPPTIHFKNLNPEIQLTDTPFYVNAGLKEWKNEKFPLRAGVNSFGIGGTNVHIVLEEPPPPMPASDGRSRHLLLLSARTPIALERNIENLRMFLEEKKEDTLGDIAYTLQTGRVPLPYRTAVVCKDREEAVKLLAVRKKAVPLVQERIRPSVVFMFSGQGSQYVNMCKDLYTEEETFREELDACLDLARKLSGKDLYRVLFVQGPGGEEMNIDNTAFTQPILFCLEYALACLLMKWGIHPDTMIGHSIGEYVAACISGVFSLEEALSLVLKRGELMQKVPKGSMLSINIKASELIVLLAGNKDLSIAAINSTESCVVAGDETAILTFKERMAEIGHSCRILRTSHAFHSYMMDGILEEFRKEVSKVKTGNQKIPFISNLTGLLAEEGQITTPAYWVDHLRFTVKFEEGLASLMNKEEVIFIEIGPGTALSAFVRSHISKKEGHKVVSLVRHEKETGHDLQYLLSGLGELWCTGLQPDWTAFYKNESRRKVSLPAYSFEKTLYPATADAYKILYEGRGGRRIVKEPDLSKWFYTPSWKLLPPAMEVMTGKEDRILIFSDDCGLSDSLVRKVRSKGQNIVTVRKGEHFTRTSSYSYEINPERKADYIRLFEDLSKYDSLPDFIVHGWGITSSAPVEFSASLAQTCFYSLMEIVKACQLQTGLSHKKISVVTTDLHAVLEKTTISATKSLSLAALKVLSQEYPTVRTNHIDISLSEEITDGFLEELYREIQTPGTGSVISLRNGRRWEQIFEKLPVRNSDTKYLARENSVYLITGGLGSVGFALAGYLLKETKGKAILLGRTKLPQREGWGALLAQELTPQPVREKIERLLSLEKEGDVLYVDNDLSRPEDLSVAIKMAEEKLGTIRGVIHAAGIIRGGSIALMSELKKEEYEEQFAAKITGLQVLREVMGARDLDFCLILSSISSVLGGIGLGAYAPANIFSDYYIRAYKEIGGLANWMSIDLDGVDLQSNSADAISKEELCSIFRQSIQLKEYSGMVVSLSDLQARLEKWVYKTSLPEEEWSFRDLPAEKVTLIPAGNEEQEEVITSTERILLKLWREFFGKGGIRRDAPFFEIGGDSLKALTLIARIHKLLNVDISLADFFQRPTIRELAEYVDASSGKQQPPLSYKPIQPAGERPYYKLSSVQKRLYFLHELNETSLEYNLSKIVRIEGSIEREKLQHVFERLLTRHESLRTFIGLVDGEPVQRISPFPIVDLACYHARENEVLPIVKKFIRPFDLYTGPLIRFGLIETGSSDFILMVDIHHIIADGVSFNLLIRDFMYLYSNEPLPDLPLQYKDYAEWQQSGETRAQIAQQKNFWLSHFSENPPALEWPADFERPLIKRPEGRVIRVLLNKDETAKLKSLAESEGVTLFMVILSLFYVLLNKLSGQNDIVIGTSSSGRQHADLEGIIGMFVNTLPLRNYPKGELPFKDFLAEVSSRALDCFSNQGFQYEDLIRELKLERDTSRNPIFDAMFVFQNFGSHELRIPGLLAKPYESGETGTTTSKFDLTLTAAEIGNQLSLEFEYSVHLFQAETVQRFIRYFRQIITAVAADPATVLSDISYIPLGELNELVYGFNATGRGLPEETVLSLFEKQADRTPENVAVRYEDSSLTYRGLRDRMDQMAGYLHLERQVKAGDLVGILLERDEYMVPVMLAILKTGAAYVPIDPSLPAARIELILAESGASALVTRKPYLPGALRSFTGIVDLDEVMNETNQQHQLPPGPSLAPGDLAYVIYTSGSTGRPKGVMIQHASLVNYIHWASKTYIGSEKAVFPLYTSVSFDLTVTSVFAPLITGNEIVVYREDKEKMLIEKVLEDNWATVIKCTPSHLKIVRDMTWDRTSFPNRVKKFIVGGEDLEMQLAKDIYEKFDGRVMIYNEYGPTEATVGCMIYAYTPGEKEKGVPIGLPISNTQVYLLDKFGKPVPVGVPGEIYISGAGMARGYLGNEPLTREAFIDNPYTGYKKMYRTGDLGCRRANGDLLYKGRIDEQVKLRGARIEPGEIEYLLNACEEIRESLVMITGESGNRQLTAFYVSDRTIETVALKSYLSNHLPEFMVPAYYIHLTSLPLSPNGKIDRKTLAAMEITTDPIEVVLPGNPTEEAVTSIWATILGIKQEHISIYSNFFELGGHSLGVVKMRKMLNDHFGTHLSVGEIFRLTNIHAIAQFVSQGDEKVRELEEGLQERSEALSLLRMRMD